MGLLDMKLTAKPTALATQPSITGAQNSIAQQTLADTKALSAAVTPAKPAAKVTAAAPTATAAPSAPPATSATSATAPSAPPSAPAQNQPRTIAKEETVAGQLNGLLSQNSDYMQSARNTALQQANSRGLINSSLAVGAGQRAAIDSALPIAQQDSQIHAQSAQSAQDSNQIATQNLQNHQYATQENQQNIDANIKLKQMDIDIDTKRLSAQQLNSLSSALSPIQQQYMSGMQTINSIPDDQMNAGAKTTAIKNLQSEFQAQLNALSSLYKIPITWPKSPPSYPAPPAPQPTPNEQESDRNGG